MADGFFARKGNNSVEREGIEAEERWGRISG
jgi:hypothetical protein